MAALKFMVSSNDPGQRNCRMNQRKRQDDIDNHLQTGMMGDFRPFLSLHTLSVPVFYHKLEFGVLHDIALFEKPAAWTLLSSFHWIAGTILLKLSRLSLSLTGCYVILRLFY